MSDLVRYYREYYRDQTASAFDDLFRCMLEYDFSSYHDDISRVHAMWREAKCVGESKFLYSGGSTAGTFRRYEFGPNFGHVRRAVEGFLRLSHHKTLLLADVGFGIRETPFGFHPSGRPPQSDFEVSATWHTESNIGRLFDLVSELHAEHGPINLCALPHIWLAITNNRSFLEMERVQGGKLNALVNTDGVRTFGPVSSVVRDQMIDWASGCNFYTCPSGRMHFLPMFISSEGGKSCTSLLNLKRCSKGSDDVVDIGQEQDYCRCGLPFVAFKILTHARNAPRNSSGEPLDLSCVPGCLWHGVKSLQIFQSEDDSLNLFYSSMEGNPLGVDRVLSMMSDLGCAKIRTVADKYFRTGQKIPLAWRGSSPKFLDFPQTQG